MRIDFSPRLQMIPLAAIGGIAQGVSGIISGIAGIGQRREGKKLLRNIGDETVPEEVLANQVEAKTMANQGLPSAQYNQAMKNIQRQQLMALRGANDRRGGLAAISTTQQLAGDALGRLDMADAQQHIANQKQLMTVNNQVGDYKHSIWERKYNYGMGLLGMGNQNLYNGIDKVAAGGGSLAYGANDGSSGSGYNEPVGGSGMNAPSYYRNVERELYRNQGRRVG